MGYNLERLKRQYGLGSASKLGYLGTTEADKAAYDKYSDEFLLRLKNRPMYANQQFVGSDLPGNYYDNILGAPVYGEGEPVTGPVDPDPVPITTPVVTPGSGINGGGDGGNGKSQWGNDANIEHLKRTGAFDSNGEVSPGTSTLSDLFNNSMYGKFFEGVSDVFGNEGTTYYGSKAPYGMGVGQPDHEKYMTGAPAWDQFTYARTPEERANPSGASVWTTGTGAPVLDGNQQPVRTSNYRPPLSSGMSRDIVAPRTGHPSFMYDSPVTNALGALPTITEQQFTNSITGQSAPAGQIRTDRGFTPMSGLGGLETLLNEEDAFYAKQEAQKVAEERAQSALAVQYANQQAAAKERMAKEQADQLAYQKLLEATGFTPAPAGQTLTDRGFTPAPSAKTRTDRGYTPSNTTNKSATSRSANPQRSSGGYTFGLAQGGHIKGYSKGGGAPNFGEELATIEDLDEATDLELLADEATDLEMLETQARQMSQPSDRANELMTMLQNTTANPNSYSAQLSTEQGSYNEAAVAFQDMITKMADGQSKGPSESEKWFRLAAAFGKPTQSGSFFDSLGNASTALADIASERRTAGAAGDALKMQGAQFGLELLKDQMENTRGLSAIERQENKDTQNMLLEWQRDNDKLAEERLYDLAVIAGDRKYESGKPKSEAAKIATDMGLEGKAYDDYVTKFYEDRMELKQLELTALTNAANQLGSNEMKAIDAIDERIINADKAVDLLVKALSINKDAYANNLGDWGSSTWDLLTFNTDSKEYKATQELEILLKKVAAAALKATFGGAGITDGEREALEKVQGLSLRDSELRGEVIKDGLAAMRSVQQKNMEKRKAILNRTAYKIQPEETE